MAQLRGWTPFAGIQVEYSLVERTVERELMPMACALGIGVTAWSPLAAGVLTGKYHAKAPGDERRLDKVPVWIDGELHRARAGDFVAFPAGTGICHTFINDGDRDALLLSGGECAKSDSRIFYPMNLERRNQMPWSSWWDDAPARPRGPHPGKPGR